jgi:hypothetical protein
VGLNTTALIEAAIVGRKSYTFLHPSVKESQEGTLHFHYLVEANGGPLSVANSLDEHLGQLSLALCDDQSPDWSRSFLEWFIRPLGLATPGSPLLADELEWLARRGTAPSRTTLGLRALRVVLLPLAAWSGRKDKWRNALLPKQYRGAEGAKMQKQASRAKRVAKQDRRKTKRPTEKKSKAGLNR